MILAGPLPLHRSSWLSLASAVVKRFLLKLLCTSLLLPSCMHEANRPSVVNCSTVSGDMASCSVMSIMQWLWSHALPLAKKLEDEDLLQQQLPMAWTLQSWIQYLSPSTARLPESYCQHGQQQVGIGIAERMLQTRSG